MNETIEQPQKNDIDLNELSQIIKITNSMPLAIALFIAIIFYRKIDHLKDCDCMEYHRKNQDKLLYLELRQKDLQLQCDDLSKTLKNSDKLNDK